MSVTSLYKLRNRFLPNGRKSIKRLQQYRQLKKISRNILFCLVIITSAVLTALTCFKLITKSDIFRIYTINITGNVDIPDHQILELSGLEKGSSLFAVNPEDIKKRLRQHSWIERAEVIRYFPASIAIKIHEYEPMALVTLNKNTRKSLYYVDIKGKIFSPATNRRDIDFPVITGTISPAESSLMRFGTATPAAAALRFLKLAAKGNAILPIRAISEVHIAKDNGLIVYLADKPFPIYLDSENIKNNYNQLVKILRRLYHQKQVDKISMIQLNYAENKALVTMIEPQ